MKEIISDEMSEEDFNSHPPIPTGSRVEVSWTFTNVKKHLGTVVGPDPENIGYYVVRLDRPARFDHGDGKRHRLSRVIEAWDNIRVLVDEKTDK